MWIKYICLENFKNIKTGLKANRIEIDFSKRENVICLITGPNGMGKTSLLSCLTPFATLGNLDIRENNQLILSKAPGYKRIIIMNNEDEIDIEHFYSVNKDTHSVKSYFKLNGKELNPNGNVTSFKSIVESILHIDMDYLKLIRLGDNVTNLIKLKSTERKNFMSKMLPSVDNYLKYYKKLMGDARDLNAVMSHLVDKRNKLGIDDEEKVEAEIEEMGQGITFHEKELERLIKEIHEIEFKLHEITLPENYREEFKKTKRKEERYRLALEKKRENVSSEELKKEIKEKSERVTYLNMQIEFLIKDNTSLMNEIDETTKELSDYRGELSSEIERSNLISLQEYLKKLLNKHKEGYSGLPFTASFTKEELDEFIVSLKNIQHELNITYEFGNRPIEEVIDLMEEDVNITEFVTANLLSIENDQSKNNKTYLDTLYDKYSKLKTPECKETCVFRDLYNDVMSIGDIKPVKKATKSSEYYQIMKVVHENLIAIINHFQESSEFIKRLPNEYQRMFVKKKVFSHIKKCEPIYDEKKINELLSIMTEYDNFMKLQKEIDEVKEKIAKEEASSKVDFFRSQIKKSEEKLEELAEKKTKLTDTLTEASEESSSLETEVDELETMMGAIENYTEVKTYLEELKKDITNFDSLTNMKIEKDAEKTRVDKKIIFLQSEKTRLEMKLSDFKTIKKDMGKCKKIYDDIIHMKSATSTKEGIPLVHIQMYLKDTRELANDLLDIVYNGSIILDEFDISGDGFKIPYIKDNHIIPDISYASQGEQSFLNMAISFALSIQNLTEYNIPLLDEVDATFDQEKREKAIDVIERQNEIIQSEQTFIISHNNMYDQYPVDVLDFEHFEDSIFDVKLS